MLGPKVLEHLSNQTSAFSCSIISGASTVQLVTAKARRFGANYGSLGLMRWVLPQNRETWIFDQMLESRDSLKWMPELLIWYVLSWNATLSQLFDYLTPDTKLEIRDGPTLAVRTFRSHHLRSYYLGAEGMELERMRKKCGFCWGRTLHFFLHVNAIEEVKEIL